MRVPAEFWKVLRPVFLLAIANTVALDPVFAQESGVPRSVFELKRLSLDELMNLEVRTVSRTGERLGGAAAAITIVTDEDIRRTGAATIPEALRLVPGIHVARQTASTWAVASRGFSSVSSEKLLVLSDTRSIYTPLFSGVFWDAQDYLMQDIEQIEVIRGPGATLWGANAVNGVNNITTKSAEDTQGLYVETSGGTEERASTAVRYGGRIAEGLHYRVFGKYSSRNDTFGVDPGSPDDWRTGHGGFHVDWDASTRDTLTVQGGIYHGDVGQLIPSISIMGREGPRGRLRVGIGGGNVLTRWERTLGPNSDLQLRAYFDRTRRNDPMFVDDLHTLDFDLQHRFSPSDRHEVTWGAGYRFTTNQNDGKSIFALDPQSARDHIVSTFVQDQIQLPGLLRLTFGTKLEHNSFSGAELQPSGRAAWDISPRHTVWGAVSRAVRVPTRIERDIVIDVTDPAADTVVRLLGNRDFESERLVAFEAGYRWQPGDAVAIDIAGFHNRYDGLASLELGDSFPDPASGRTVFPLRNENRTSGWARGVETLIVYSPHAASRLTASYSYLVMRLDTDGQDLNRGAFLDGSTPRHQFALRYSWDLPSRFQADALYRYLSAIERIPTSATGEGLPGYSELDVRLGWLGWERTEISVIAQNLLHAHHLEFGAPGARGEIQRSVYVKFAWGF
jgi:iron complex outermembrane receptor protein